MLLRPSLDRAVNIEDLRKLARRRTPDVVFDYIDGGAEGEVTLRDNRRSWDDVLFRPKNAVRVSKCDTSTSVLGTDLSMPMLLAPVGYSRIFHPDGELGVARAARDAGIGYVLSTFSGYAVDKVGTGGRAAVVSALSCRRAAGGRGIARARVGRRVPRARGHDRHQRARATANATSATAAPQLIGGGILAKLPFVPHLLRHPRWLAGYLSDRKEVMFYPNVVQPGVGPMRARDVRGNLLTVGGRVGGPALDPRAAGPARSS